MAEPTFNPPPEANLPALRDLEALCRELATKHGREALFAMHAKSAEELQNFIDTGKLKTVGHYLDNAQRLILAPLVGESFALVCIETSRTMNRLLDLPAVLKAGEKLAEEPLKNHTAPALAKYCLSAWRAMETVRNAPRIYFEEVLAIVAVALNRSGVQPKAAGEYSTLGWNFSYRNGPEKLFILNPKTGSIEPTQEGWDGLKELEMEKNTPPAPQEYTPPPETYPYFFLRDGTKVLAESPEAQVEFERLTNLVGYPVKGLNFYRVKGGLGERRILPDKVTNHAEAEKVRNFICDGDSNWSALLTQACKAGNGDYLPEGLMYHVNIERGKKEIQDAAEKLLDWNEGRLLCDAIAHHLFGVSAFSQMYGVFRGDTLSALQRAVIMRGIDGAAWLLQLNAPRFAQTGVDLAELKKALVDVAHDFNNKSAHDVCSKARALFKMDSGVKPPQSKPPAMADPRRVHYYPLKDRGRTTVVENAEGMRQIHEAFQQYQHGHDTHYITEAEMATLAKWGFKTGHGIWGDVEAILIRDGKIGPAECRELSAPQALSLLAKIELKPMEDAATKDVLTTPAGSQSGPTTQEPKKKPWHIVGLPLALNDLAIALEKLGGESEASDIKKQTERNPSDTLGKYPNWKWWIDAWILRPKETGRKGVYGLRSEADAKLILERTSKKTLTSR